MGIFNWGKAIEDAGTGVKTAFTGIGAGVGQIINSAKGQVPPELQGQLSLLETEVQGQIKQAEIATSIKVQEILAEAQREVYAFALKYEGTAEQVPRWILTLRSLIRPIVTICMFFSLLFFMGYDIQKIMTGKEMIILSALPQPYWVILGIIVGFWFGGKAGENMIDKIKAGK
jgi:hypothetical protein